jgi:hypothetical protein
MVVRRIIEGIPRPLLTSPVDKLKEFHHDGLYQGGGAMTVLVAAGPYTTTDSLEYEPLEDLLKVRTSCYLSSIPPSSPSFLLPRIHCPFPSFSSIASCPCLLSYLPSSLPR